MAGKNCVGICSDRRLGIQAQSVAKDFQKVDKQFKKYIPISLK
jgi:hypothetical protein